MTMPRTTLSQKERKLGICMLLVILANFPSLRPYDENGNQVTKKYSYVLTIFLAVPFYHSALYIVKVDNSHQMAPNCSCFKSLLLGPEPSRYPEQFYTPLPESYH